MIKKFSEKYNLSFLSVFKKDESISVYVFGGAIRDIILEREWKEIDLRIVYNKDREERESKIEYLLHEYNLDGKTRIDSQNLTVYRFLPIGSNTNIPIDLSLVPTIEDNLPDFTINSIFYDLKTGKIIDNFNGRQDLAEKVIKTVKDPDTQFKDEPHMIFRALKFSCQLGFEIEIETLKAIARNKKEVQNTFNFIMNNKEGVFVELFLGNIFKGLKDDPLKYFKYINETGLFDEFIKFYSDVSGISVNQNNNIQIRDLGSYEKNISYLFSEVINAFNLQDKASHFNNLISLLSIASAKKYSDFTVNTSLIGYLS